MNLRRGKWPNGIAPCCICKDLFPLDQLWFDDDLPLLERIAHARCTPHRSTVAAPVSQAPAGPSPADERKRIHDASAAAMLRKATAFAGMFEPTMTRPAVQSTPPDIRSEDVIF